MSPFTCMFINLMRVTTYFIYVFLHPLTLMGLTSPIFLYILTKIISNRKVNSILTNKINTMSMYIKIINFQNN